MAVKEGAIVVRVRDHKDTPTNYRVEQVNGIEATIRNLSDYSLTEYHVDELSVRYHTDFFDAGDTVRVRKEYMDQYNEADGGNDLTVVASSNTSGRTSTTQVENNNGTEFRILTERLMLIKPAVSFKTGDRVIVDLDLAKKYHNDGVPAYWRDVRPLVLTEDSGSRAYKTTSHVVDEADDRVSNNVPTRWLKLYEEPAKRVVGETVKAVDIKVGDKVSVSQTIAGIHHVMTGIVGDKPRYFGDASTSIVSSGGGVFPYESKGAVFTLLEEAPEPVDENLQRLLDAPVGDIAHGTYANEYWKKVEQDLWTLIGGGVFGTTEGVFDSLYKLKYGTLAVFTKVDEG